MIFIERRPLLTGSNPSATQPDMANTIRVFGDDDGVVWTHDGTAYLFDSMSKTAKREIRNIFHNRPYRWIRDFPIIGVFFDIAIDHDVPCLVTLSQADEEVVMSHIVISSRIEYKDIPTLTGRYRR